MATSRPGATASVEADLPALLDAPAGAPASASVELANLPLQELAARLGVAGPVRGTGALTARLSGTAGEPRLEASLRLDGASWAGLPAASLGADLVAGRDTALQATLDTAGGPVRLRRGLHRGFAARQSLAAPDRADPGGAVSA
jgi:hypothetical protein